jgi:Bacterial lectin/Legume lectin domain/Chitobiase/beta-hexosaminidase C-terminal domain
MTLPRVVKRNCCKSKQTRLIDGYLWAAALLIALMFVETSGQAQVNVFTAHNDTARTGQNLNETILTPSNVNPTQFGKLFSHPVNGSIWAQPLYVANVTINGQLHNVVYVATTGNYEYNTAQKFTGDYVYAFDADTNGGGNANPLWQVSLLTAPVPTPGSYPYQFGVIGTPVIDPLTNTMYLVDAEMQNAVLVHRLHALDITTGAEKFGGPVQIQPSIPGTGSGSSNGTLAFNDVYQFQRPALLLMNGVLYIGFGAVNDEGPWHGWLLSYNPATLLPIDIFCTTPDGSGGGLWMGGAGLAGEVYNPAKPYGRMFVATGNGTFGINAPTVSGQPYSNPSNEYGMSVLDLDLTNGMFTVEDEFTPFNEANLNSHDADLGSGGPVLLPTQTMASGNTLKGLVQIGKSGMFYILDRDNNTDGSNNAATEYSPAGLGGFNTTADQVVQEVQTPETTPGFNWGAGVWGTSAYWNNTIYSGGTNVANPTNAAGAGTSFSAYSYVNGVLATTPTSQSVEQYFYPGPTPSISANGNTNGIVWTLNHGTLDEIVEAYDATNLANQLYSSNTNLTRENPGVAEEYIVPTIANGKVFVGTLGFVSVYGLLAGEPTAPSPVITPGTTTFDSPVTVTMTDAIAGAVIYYTTDGSTPTTNSAVYQSTNPPVVSTTETITAIASIVGYLQSAPSSATYTSTETPANPVFSLAAGTYTGTQTLTITEPSSGTVVYYTVDGSAPTIASLVYTHPLTISASQTVQAVAVYSDQASSSVVSATYAIQPAGVLNFSNGFALADGIIQFNGSTDLDDYRLQLTNGGTNEAGSAFYATPVNIQQFTTNFTFQLSNPSADGITFTIQNNSATSVGGPGGQLGYGSIPNSVAIKFDLYNNAGEGSDSTGLYTNGAIPTVPTINLSTTGINLHSGDYFNVTLTYDGSNLTLTITDAITFATWSHVFVVNIPAIVGSNTAYVGFTGGTGGQTSSQKLTSWTYVPGPPLPSYTAGFTAGSMTLNGGAAITTNALELTDGNPNEARSAFFTTPVNIQQFVTNFQFQLLDPNSDGFTFTIQGNSPKALGWAGSNLGYGSILNSVAVKFDLFNNAGEGTDSTGLYINGATPTVPAIDLSSTGIHLHSGDVFNAQLSYDGITLTVVITDTVTNATAAQSYTVDIPFIVAGPTAWVGFTASSGGQSAVQEILNWSYNPGLAAEPSFFTGFSTSQSQMTLNGGAALNGTRLRLTDGNANEARSAFFTKPLSIQKFVSVFDFQLTNPNGDGFTFAIQGNVPTVVGASGGQLGYGGIPNSVAVKFDLYSNAGEGPDSTGFYIKGAPPTMPAINLTGTGINLHSGDPFNALITYDGATLTVLITDKVTNASATQSYTVNIPSIVGGTTAYVGFTGASGGATAVQEILDWNYAAAAVN